MMRVQFCGGVGNVTGANFLFETESSKFLVDCGLVQGDRFAPAKNCEPFAYTPSEVSTLLVTHAHADHIGRIPKLVRDGFNGTIYSTPATRDLAEVMFMDAYKVMIYEEERYGTPRCYELADISHTLAFWKVHAYHDTFSIPDGVSVTFTDAGHILGSAMITLERRGKKFLCTGDIGNVPQPLMNAPEIVEGYDYLLMESVYGDRAHEEVKERADLLRMYIEDTTKKGGTLIIPAFSLERTQHGHAEQSGAGGFSPQVPTPVVWRHAAAPGHCASPGGQPPHAVAGRALWRTGSGHPQRHARPAAGPVATASADRIHGHPRFVRSFPFGYPAHGV